MAVQANCPACGAQVLFKTGSSVVVVCEFCHSVVARTDRGIEDVGKVAEVAETASPLEVGLRGVCRGVAFELTGRAQLQHAAGGTWDEWYAALADGRWGWLAEAQGRFYLTFQIQVPDPRALPFFDQIQLGQPVTAIPTPIPLVVAEKGEARMLAAEGEIPYLLKPGETYYYADISGQDGVFGTLDYGEHPPAVFVGRQVTLEELGLAQARRTTEREARRVAATRLNCPNCAGPMELRAPDQTERVTCPNCGSLLDVNRGEFRYLKTLEPKGPPPSIPIGATAEFEGHPMTVIGFMVRSVTFEGTRYFWQEYLLYNPAVGFRWLVESDQHWSYVRTLQPAEVEEPDPGKLARYGGKTFKIFQDAPATVEHVRGEFYWKVSVGERVRAVDFVRPPLMLSKEVSGARPGRRGEGPLAAEEINWSLGEYVPVKEIRKKFGVELPPPHTVAPNQPFRHKGVYKYWLLLTFAALAVGVFALVTSPRTRVFEANYTLRPQPAAAATPPPAGSSGSALAEYTERLRQQLQPATGSEGTQVIFTDAFELKARHNVRVTGTANVDNNWLYVAGDLINEETGLVQQFDLPIEYYAGVEGGESWTEGGRTDAATLPALPAGRYTMRLEAQWENWNQSLPPQLTVRVEQGVPRLANLILVVVALSVIPLLVAFWQLSFERRRWADSTFNPYDTEGSDE
jgi:Zn finger protein HypA/HybF involved in hydrogenase expression